MPVSLFFQIGNKSKPNVQLFRPLLIYRFELVLKGLFISLYRCAVFIFTSDDLTSFQGFGKRCFESGYI